MVELCKSLMSEREEMYEQDTELKEKWIYILAELVCVVIVTFSMQCQRNKDEKTFRFKVSEIHVCFFNGNNY